MSWTRICIDCREEYDPADSHQCPSTIKNISVEWHQCPCGCGFDPDIWETLLLTDVKLANAYTESHQCPSTTQPTGPILLVEEAPTPSCRVTDEVMDKFIEGIADSEMLHSLDIGTDIDITIVDEEHTRRELDSLLSILREPIDLFNIGTMSRFRKLRLKISAWKLNQIVRWWKRK